MAQITRNLTNDDDGMPVELERQRLDSITRDLIDALGDREARWRTLRLGVWAALIAGMLIAAFCL